MVEEELKKKIADLIYEARWIIDRFDRCEIGDFYMDNEDEVVEKIIKIVLSSD